MLITTIVKESISMKKLLSLVLCSTSALMAMEKEIPSNDQVTQNSIIPLVVNSSYDAKTLHKIDRLITSKNSKENEAGSLALLYEEIPCEKGIVWLKNSDKELALQVAQTLAFKAKGIEVCLHPSYITTKNDRWLTLQWLKGMNEDLLPTIIAPDIHTLLKESNIKPELLARFLQKLSARHLVVITVDDLTTLPEPLKILANQPFHTYDSVYASIYDIKEYTQLQNFFDAIEKHFKKTHEKQLEKIDDTTFRENLAEELRNLETISQWCIDNKIESAFAMNFFDYGEYLNEPIGFIWEQLHGIKNNDCINILNLTKPTEQEVDLDDLEKIKKIYFAQKKQLQPDKEIEGQKNSNKITKIATIKIANKGELNSIQEILNALNKN